MPCSQIEGQLKELLKRFGPPRQTVHAEFPFGRLPNDGLWEMIPQDKTLSRTLTFVQQNTYAVPPFDNISSLIALSSAVIFASGTTLIDSMSPISRLRTSSIFT